MNNIFRNYFKYPIYLFVLIGLNISFAGSYDDFFRAIRMDDAAEVRQLLARGFDPNTLDPQGQHGLLIAIKEPSPKVAKALVDAPNINLNILNRQGESPLMLAALKGQLDLASQMVEKGADVNKTGWTPLHYAASNSNLPLIKLLLENSAYIDAESPNGTTPLMMASMYGSAEAVKLLLEEGADPQLKNQQGMTAIQFAQRANRKDVAELIAKSIRSQRPPGQW
ncbi:ankyrin repeat domain-containing protein [Polaromonas sp.]|uniref:ankyrin repeat domain-containing protein n=1 Tax=Polaromonas sp. TaxID=1869339 RepID=UPI00352B7530